MLKIEPGKQYRLNDGRTYTVLAIDKDMAWIKWRDGTRKNKLVSTLEATSTKIKVRAMTLLDCQNTGDYQAKTVIYNGEPTILFCCAHTPEHGRNAWTVNEEMKPLSDTGNDLAYYVLVPFVPYECQG